MKINLCIDHNCNWGCNYCLRKSEVNKGRTHISDEGLKLIPDILALSNDIKISGGEPGLANIKLIQYISQCCIEKHWISLNTNGMIFKNNIPWKRHILYHVVPELNHDINFPGHCGLKNVTPTFVIHRQNIKMVREFCDDYRFIMFDPSLYVSDSPLHDNFALRHEDYGLLLEELKHVINVNLSFKLSVESLCKTHEKELEEFRTHCRDEKKFRVRFDLVNNKIITCCLFGSNPNLELTKENIDAIKAGTLQFDWDERICSNCPSPVNNYYNNYGKGI